MHASRAGQWYDRHHFLTPKIIAVVALVVGGMVLVPAIVPGTHPATSGPSLVSPATTDPTDPYIDVNPDDIDWIYLPTSFDVTAGRFTGTNYYQLLLNGVNQPYTQPAEDVFNFQGTPPCGTNTLELIASPIVIHVVPGSAPHDSALSLAQQTATTQLIVECPEITLTPSTVEQPSEPTSVEVDGDKFHSKTPVNLEVDGKIVKTGTTQYSDGAGAQVELSFTAQGLGCGTHQVTLAEDTSTEPYITQAASASATLTVQDCPGAPPPPPPGAPAALALNPTVLQPNELTKATGTGFTPNQPVTLVWEAMDGSPLLGSTTVTADATGAIQADCLVFDNDETGVRQLVAEQNGSTNAIATATALVNPGTLQPASGGQFVFRR